MFIETREANEGTWLYFEDPLKQEQTLSYQGDTFEIDLVQYLFDQDKKPNILTIINLSDSTTTKTVTNSKKKDITNELLTATEQSFSPTDISETDLRDY